MRPIKYCACGNICEGTLDLCASCNHAERKAARMKLPKEPKAIAKQSDEMKRMMALYVRKKARWIKGKKCAVLKNVPATDVHHMAGRGINSYYDEWARDNNMPLLLDERFFLPVSREGHIEITNRPAWAKRMGYSEDRLVPSKMRSV